MTPDPLERWRIPDERVILTCPTCDVIHEQLRRDAEDWLPVVEAAERREVMYAMGFLVSSFLVSALSVVVILYLLGWVGP